MQQVVGEVRSQEKEGRSCSPIERSERLRRLAVGRDVGRHGSVRNLIKRSQQQQQQPRKQCARSDTA